MSKGNNSVSPATKAVLKKIYRKLDKLSATDAHTEFQLGFSYGIAQASEIVAQYLMEGEDVNAGERVCG